MLYAKEYTRETLWVKHAVGILKHKDDEQPEEKQEEIDSGFYHWILTAKVTKVVAPILVKEPDMKWQLLVNYNPESPSSFKRMIELKVSTVNVEGKEGLMGMFAAVRFEKGEIITVYRVNEVPKMLTFNALSSTRNHVYFGGGWAVDAEEAVGKRNNAIPNDEGIVRATQRILPGQEIFVDYKRERRHPVEYLDAVVKLSKGVRGKVINFGRNKEDKLYYLVKTSAGDTVELNETELWSKLKKKSNSRKRHREKVIEDQIVSV